MTAVSIGARSRYARSAVVTLVVAITTIGTLTILLGASLAGGFIEMRRDLAETRRFVDRAASSPTGGTAESGGNVSDLRGRRLLNGVDAADMQAQFQNIVKEAAARHGFAFDSLQVLKTERAAGLTRVSLRLDGQVPQANIGAFLVDLATGTPIIVLQGLELRPQIVQSNRLGTGTAPGESVAARIELAVYTALAARTERAGGKP